MNATNEPPPVGEIVPPIPERFVYRLEVEYPPESEESGWHPPNWEPEWIGPDEMSEFRWPVAKPYLSRSGAVARARLLTSYGATVRIFRSARVEWPDGGTPIPFKPLGPERGIDHKHDLAILGGDLSDF